MIQLEPHPEGVVLPVRAQPGASKSSVRGEQEGQLKVGVTQVAEKGKANKALVQLLSKVLDVRRSQIELISGETAANKRFLIRGVTVEVLVSRIEWALKELQT
jgi:uncharacterized protein (TIGR00251 family)